MDSNQVNHQAGPKWPLGCCLGYVFSNFFCISPLLFLLGLLIIYVRAFSIRPEDRSPWPWVWFCKFSQFLCLGLFFWSFLMFRTFSSSISSPLPSSSGEFSYCDFISIIFLWSCHSFPFIRVFVNTSLNNGHSGWPSVFFRLYELLLKNDHSHFHPLLNCWLITLNFYGLVSCLVSVGLWKSMGLLRPLPLLSAVKNWSDFTFQLC